ncbi:ATP-binding protein [Paramylibacter ulvae]|nr:ATP-binding protein [Amylibacter ulvae]
MSPRRLKPSLQSKSAKSAQDRPMITHDLQSAMSDVINGLKLIEIDELSGENQIHYDRACSASDTLQRMLAVLFDNLKGEKNDLATEIRAFELAKFVSDIQRRWHSRASAKQIEFKITSAPNLPEKIQIDRTALERILSNILENAIKFCDEGLVQLDIGINLDENLMFVVRDNGPGFSKEALNLLYEYKGRPENSAKSGTGLGLHIVKRLVDQLDGTIDVFNQTTGAFVTVEIPYSSWRVSEQSSKIPDDEFDLSGLRILLAEDNQTSQMVLRKQIEGFGAIPTLVDNGLDALRQLETEDFDAALMDIEMPVMSGLDTIMQLRKRDDIKGAIPIIAVSAYVMPGDREKIMLGGADHIVTKPVTDAAAFRATIGATIAAKSDENQRRFATQKISREPLIDQDIYTALESSVGREDMHELLSKILIDLKSVAGALKKFVAAMDVAGVRAQTHVLVSVAGAIGAKSVQKSAESLNISANHEEINQVREYYLECATGLTKLIVEVDHLKQQNAFISS